MLGTPVGVAGAVRGPDPRAYLGPPLWPHRSEWLGENDLPEVHRQPSNRTTSCCVSPARALLCQRVLSTPSMGFRHRARAALVALASVHLRKARPRSRPYYFRMGTLCGLVCLLRSPFQSSLTSGILTRKQTLRSQPPSTLSSTQCARRKNASRPWRRRSCARPPTTVATRSPSGFLRARPCLTVGDRSRALGVTSQP